MTNRKSTSSIVFVALFAALTVLGTMIKIPLPTGDFVHLGNAVVLLAVLLIGYTRGALAGGIGFAIFDVMNGYASEAPYFIVESFVVGGAATIIILLLRRRIDRVWKIIVVAFAAGLAKITMTQLKNTGFNLLAGADINVSFTSALSKLPATLINVVLTIIIVSLAYFPLKRALSSITSRHSI